jgi:hypothetical protein
MTPQEQDFAAIQTALNHLANVAADYEGITYHPEFQKAYLTLRGRELADR